MDHQTLTDLEIVMESAVIPIECFACKSPRIRIADKTSRDKISRNEPKAAAQPMASELSCFLSEKLAEYRPTTSIRNIWHTRA